MTKLELQKIEDDVDFLSELIDRELETNNNPGIVDMLLEKLQVLKDTLDDSIKAKSRAHLKLVKG